MSTTVQEPRKTQRPGFRIESRTTHDELHELVYDGANNRISQQEALERYGKILQRVRHGSALRKVLAFLQNR